MLFSARWSGSGRGKLSDDEELRKEGLRAWNGVIGGVGG